MTEATVEKVARLLHAESNEYIKSRPEHVKLRVVPFESLEPSSRQRYRHVARKVLKALGH